MTFVLEFAGDPYAADEDATGLVAWLDEDDDLRGGAETRMQPAAPGEMGGLADAARIALAGAAPLAKAVGAWLADRVRNKGPVKVSVRREGTGTVAFDIEASSVADIEALMPRIEAFFAAAE